MRVYKRTYGLRQICNIAVYIVHSACTIHLLNLPDKTAKRDIIHGVKHLEEIAEDWLCARRTLSILSVLARKWKIELPEEASTVFARTDAKYGTFSTADLPSPKTELIVQTPPSNEPSPQVPRQVLLHPNPPRSQNQLQQSLYSYAPETKAAVLNSANMLQSHPLKSYQNPCTLTEAQQQSTGMGSMNVPNDTLLASVPYSRQHFTAITPTANTVAPGDGMPRSDSANTNTTASATMTRQVSPNTMFGGVEALAASQDWWLRDQANLAIGFDNWELAGLNGGGINGSGNGNANANDSGNWNSSDIDLMAGMGSAFYGPSPGNRRSGGYGEVDWNNYS